MIAYNALPPYPEWSEDWAAIWTSIWSITSRTC